MDEKRQRPKSKGGREDTRHETQDTTHETQDTRHRKDARRKTQDTKREEDTASLESGVLSLESRVLSLESGGSQGFAESSKPYALRSVHSISPADLGKVTTYPLRERENKVKISDFASPAAAGRSVWDLLEGLPRILAGNSLRQLVSAIQLAHAEARPVIAMMGGHVIKCGLGPVIISMMERGILTGIAMNGAASIHDFEIALIGETSEDVGTNIATGKFGMWEETGRLMNEAVKAGISVSSVTDKNVCPTGMGSALGRKLLELGAPHLDVSILAAAFRLNIPATVHVAIGTDIIHQHPEADGAALGETSFTDFRIFVSEVSNLGHGGVILNLGSAVIMPEVFLKALSIARNLGHNVVEFTAANFDMIQHYRPTENVVRRPTHIGGKGYTIIGHHEIMIPLLAHAVIDQIAQRD
jgi:hypothetical protein